MKDQRERDREGIFNEWGTFRIVNPLILINIENIIHQFYSSILFINL